LGDIGKNKIIEDLKNIKPQSQNVLGLVRAGGHGEGEQEALQDNLSTILWNEQT